MKLKAIYLCVLFFGLNHYAESNESPINEGITPEQSPYQALVQTKLFYGAILITDSFVISPAHYLTGFSTVKVYLGFEMSPWFPSNLNETNTQIFNCTKIIFHEELHKTEGDHYVNDIALVKLPEPATFNNKIRPGLLLSKEEVYLLEDKFVIEIGWLTKPNMKKTIFIRQILNQDICRFIYGPQFLETQEICIKSAPTSSIHLLGNILVVNGKILGYLTLSYIPCKNLNDKCGSFTVGLSLAPFLNWISEKVGVSVASLTGKTQEKNCPISSVEIEANINRKMGNILSQFDEMKEEIKGLKAEMKTLKNVIE